MQDRASGNVATPCENRIGIVVTDRVGNIRSVNDIFTQMTGYTAAEAIGRTPAMLRSGMHSKEYYKLFWKSLAEQGHWEGEIWNKRKTGEIYPQRSHVLAVFDSAGVVINYIALTQDASTKIKIDEKLHQLPDFDGLTGLPNRIHFEKAVAKAIAEHPDAPFTIGFFDLDNFTSINDALGHIAGDRLLYQLASRMRIELRDRDQLARWGGDKFALFLCGTETGEQVHAAIQRMHNALTRPISISGTQVTPVARAGISRYPTDARDVDALLQAADTAQGRAKHQGIGSICHYSSELGKAVQQNFELANELRIALKEHQFFMMYQPQVDATGSRLVGLEALIRWRHPTRGIVSPALFISLAEEANLMVELGTEVLHLVCRQIAHWRREFPFDVPVGINVSPQQLKPGFPEKLAQALQDNQLPAHLIEIEITESALKPTPEIRALVNEIKSLGVNLAIDDFGTGYSSLSHLKLFPFDRLKIDKTFVDGLPDNADDIAIGQAIIALGQALKVNVIAEGVESDAQAEFLRVQGVHAIQGYLYSKPIQEELVPDYFLKSCRDTSS
jgi:diguanylate cyclase (GGDEF)-like protein/PAS domain S-box-containing protein